MTRKDYIAIAATLRTAREDSVKSIVDYPCDDILDRLEEAWVALLARNNPEFSPTKFKEASRP